jgi:long-subunit acyl-CoA synthetase (AMP-forming)
VAIDNGEIVVSSPTLMNGYLNAQPVSGRWHTGDLGHFDEEGFLVVTGRKDNIIVTAAGRNISPEWIEERIAADSRIGRCVLVADEGELNAVIVPRDCAGSAAAANVIAEALHDLPDYAKPRRFVILAEQELRALDLLTANGRPRRSEIRRFVSASSNSFSAQIGKEAQCLHI